MLCFFSSSEFIKWISFAHQLEMIETWCRGASTALNLLNLRHITRYVVSHSSPWFHLLYCAIDIKITFLKWTDRVDHRDHDNWGIGWFNEGNEMRYCLSEIFLIFLMSQSDQQPTNDARRFLGVKCRNPNCRQKVFKNEWAYETHRRHWSNVGTLCAADGMMFQQFVDFPASVATARLMRDPCENLVTVLYNL